MVTAISSFTPILYQPRCWYLFIFSMLPDIFFLLVKGNVCTNSTQDLQGSVIDSQCLENKIVHQGGEPYLSELRLAHGTFIHRVKFLCVSSIGVTTDQAFCIYVCINTYLLQLFPSRILRDFFFVCLFPQKTWNFIPWYRTGRFCTGDVLPVPLSYSLNF